MKLQKIIFAPLFLICLFLQTNPLLSQNITTTGDYMERMKTSASFMTFEFNDNYQNFTVEIAGPEDFYLRKEMKQVSEIALSSTGMDDDFFEDGAYKIQITPNFKLSKAEQKVLRYLTETDQREKLKAKKELLDIPTEVQNYTRYYTILNGKFVLPKNEANGLKLSLPQDNRNPTRNLTTLRLATNNAKPTFTGLSAGMGLNKPKPMFAHLGLDPQPIFVDEVIMDDLIVDGSACIGADCVNGESFGFDTIRLKENNIRIKALDNSADIGFPSRDWQITFNENTNGGADKFSIDDIDSGRTPFTIEADAPSHSLYVDDGGRVGIGTSTPVVDIHNKSGNSPTLRLEQDGSSGFGIQAWDIVGNETSFFIRDVTNGSTLPFRIRPGAPSSSIDIKADGKVGLGLTSPEQKLHVMGNVAISGSILPVSDRRLKKEIQPIENGMEIIQKLNATSYYFKTEKFAEMNLPSKLQYGFIAQEIQKVLPDLVEESNNSDKEKAFMRLNYTGVIPFLVKGMQEQQTIIEAQQEQIEALEQKVNEIDQLKEQVASLVKLMEKDTEDSSDSMNSEKR